MLTSLHIQGTSPLHRVGAGAKLSGLAIASIALFVTSAPLVLGGCLILSAVAYFSTGVGVRTGVRRLMPALWSVLLLMLFNLFLLPWQEVGVIAVRILSLVFCAAAVTATTTLAEMMLVVDRTAMPLERLGILQPGDAGLAIGLCMRFVPDILTRYEALREAHRARGLKVRFSTLLGPLIILTLKQADEVAMAIDARGLRGTRSPPTLQRQIRP